MRKHGWKYGPKFSDLNKTEPCLAPYSELDDENKAHDAIMIQTAIAVAKAIRELGMYNGSIGLLQ